MDFERKLKKLPRREFLKLALACLLAAGCDFENNGMTTEFPLSFLCPIRKALILELV
jgi:hypothetical protein